MFYTNTINDDQFRQYIALCDELEDLSDEMEGTCMVLGIDVIRHSSPLADDDWKRIEIANKGLPPTRDWESWQVLPNRRWFVRFTADEDDTAFQEFKNYAERVNSIFDRYDELPIPEGLAWRTRPNGAYIDDGHSFLLQMVVNTDPTLARFGYMDGLYGFDPVAPNGVKLEGLRCEYFLQYAGPAVLAWLPPSRPRIGPTPPFKPTYDSVARELRFGSTLIKRFTKPAENQERVLLAFEEEKWVERVDDPLSPVPGLVSKDRLRRTIDALNDGHALPRIVKFRGDGTGQGIRWTFLPKP